MADERAKTSTSPLTPDTASEALLSACRLAGLDPAGALGRCRRCRLNLVTTCAHELRCPVATSSTLGQRDPRRTLGRQGEPDDDDELDVLQQVEQQFLSLSGADHGSPSTFTFSATSEDRDDGDSH